MIFFVRTFWIVLISVLMAFIMTGTAASQDPDNIDINDIAGRWRIEVIDRPNSPFKGSAEIPRGKGHSIMATTITEDKCCSGNHARVLQDSRITITDGQIKITSQIVKYLLHIENIKIRYHPDDFSLRWVDENTLEGTANGHTSIRWVRDQLEVS